MSRDFPKELAFLYKVIVNLDDATERIQHMLLTDDRSEGAIMVVHIQDVRKDKSERKRRHRFEHTELGYEGTCASDEFQKNFIGHIRDRHQALIEGTATIALSKYNKAEAALRHIERPLDDKRRIDALFAVWGCETLEQNEAIMSQLTKNL